MEKLGCDLDFAQKALRADRGREIGGEHLDRDLTIVFQIAGEIDRGHRTAADLTLDQIAPAESAAHALQKAGRTSGFGRFHARHYITSISPSRSSRLRRSTTRRFRPLHS